jgi:hypothetical protein
MGEGMSAREHKLTAWEVGNDLCACADYLGEKEVDAFDNGWTEHAALLRDCRIKIAKFFNRNHPKHGFGLGPVERRKP